MSFVNTCWIMTLIIGWCIENGRYTREVWYNLMTASLNEKYRTLLDEILA